MEPNLGGKRFRWIPGISGKERDSNGESSGKPNMAMEKSIALKCRKLMQSISSNSPFAIAMLVRRIVIAVGEHYLPSKNVMWLLSLSLSLSSAINAAYFDCSAYVLNSVGCFS